MTIKTNNEREKIEKYIFDLETLCLEEFGRIPKPKKAIRKDIDSLISFIRQETIEEIGREIEIKKKKHRVFECNNGTHEDWCENENCPSQDNTIVKAYNQALSDIINLIQSKKENI